MVYGTKHELCHHNIYREVKPWSFREWEYGFFSPPYNFDIYCNRYLYVHTLYWLVFLLSLFLFYRKWFIHLVHCHLGTYIGPTHLGLYLISNISWCQAKPDEMTLSKIVQFIHNSNTLFCKKYKCNEWHIIAWESLADSEKV